MDRDEFMELVYETFADEPDNVLANGIIEAADAYAEHEKAQLSQEGTTKDAISRQAVLDAIVQCTNCGDEDTLRGYVLKHSLDNGWTGGVLEALDAVKNLPPAQPNKNAREFIKLTARYSNGRPYYSIIYLEYDKNGVGHDFEGYSSYSLDVISDYLKKYFMPSAQPEPHWIPCEERMPEEHEWLGTKKFGTTISDEVYVTFENEKGERFCKHMTFQNGELSRYDKAYVDVWFKGSKPIAWMPLPETYKGE